MVKEELTTGRVAKMMGISVRTLRYYDQIGLLKPGSTLPNGRRQYSKEDLLELEKIMILKSAQFSLEHIKTLRDQLDTISIIEMHKRRLHSEIEQLTKSLQHTNTLLNMYQIEGSLSWEALLKLVRQPRHKPWKESFSEEEAEILAERLPKAENDDFITKQWLSIIKRIKLCLKKEVPPESEWGKQIAEDIMCLSDHSFKGHKDLVDRFWEVRKSEEPNGLYPLDSGILEFAEKALESASNHSGRSG